MKYPLFIPAFCAAVLFFSFAFSHFAHSQTALSASNFAVILTQTFDGTAKNFPGPHESYAASVRGSTVDLDHSTIVWTKNGVTVLRGLGVKTYPYSTGDAGTRDTISVSITGPNGERYTASKTITVSDVDLLWFAETTVPSWYDGKALASPRSQIRVVAMPDLRRNGIPIPPSQLVYRWKQNGAILASSSGAGRQTLSLTGDILPSARSEITLTITDLAETIGAQKTITMTLIQPLLRFYAEDFLEGTLTNRSIAELLMTSDSQRSVRAIPFFFSEIKALAYEWRIDGNPVDAGGPPDLLELAATAGAKGASGVNVVVQNPNNILEKSSNNLTIRVQ